MQLNMEVVEFIVTLFAALLTPTIAIIGILLGVQSYKLEVRKRKDNLFDRLYEFLKNFEKAWKTTGPESLGATISCLEWDDIESFAQEAQFLFGKDISDHIRSYEGKSFDQQFPWVPDYKLAKPFYKYLCFEDE